MEKSSKFSICSLTSDKTSWKLRSKSETIKKYWQNAQEQSHIYQLLESHSFRPLLLVPLLFIRSRSGVGAAVSGISCKKKHFREYIQLYALALRLMYNLLYSLWCVLLFIHWAQCTAIHSFFHIFSCTKINTSHSLFLFLSSSSSPISNSMYSNSMLFEQHARNDLKLEEEEKKWNELLRSLLLLLRRFFFVLDFK